MDNTNTTPIPVSNGPSISPIPDSVINKPAGTKSKKNIQIVGAVVLIIIIILVSVLAASQLLSKKNNNATTDNNDDVNTETGTNTDTDNDDDDDDDDADLPHRVYYLVEDDIYYYDVATNIEKKVFTFTGLADPSASQSVIFSSTYIDEDTLGFHLCDTITNNFNCKIYRLDAVSGTTSVLETRGSKDFVLHAKFFGKNYFTYYYEDTSVGTDEARAVLAGSKITSGTSDFLIAEYETDEPVAYGRGGFEADDAEISYSPDGKYISFIRTSNILNGNDFSIRLYDTTTNSEYAADPVIENATHPFWISNTKLAYKVFTNDTSPDNGKLIIHDIVSGTKTTVAIPASDVTVRTFSVLGEKFLYTDAENNVKIFDNATGTSELVIDNAVRPVWVDENHIVFYPVEDCTDCIDGTTQLEPVIYNLDTNSFVKTLTNSFSFVTAYSD